MKYPASLFGALNVGGEIHIEGYVQLLIRQTKRINIGQRLF